MQYTVVHSKDPYLLARLATDLQMSGVKVDDWHEYGDPFSQDCFWKYIKKEGKTIEFHTHHCIGYDCYRPVLTSRNYIKVLTQILEP